MPRLQAIFERGQANQVRCRLIDEKRLRELEPNAAGLHAIHVPDAGIVDYPAVCDKLAELFLRARGGSFIGAEVERILSSGNEVNLETPRGSFRTDWLITCGGLYADHLAALGGHKPEAQIVPFRGEFFELRPAAAASAAGI